MDTVSFDQAETTLRDLTEATEILHAAMALRGDEPMERFLRTQYALLSNLNIYLRNLCADRT